MSVRVGCVLLLGLLASPAVAFTVESGFTTGCHERITAAGFLVSRASFPLVEPEEPPDGEWVRLADYLAPETGDLPPLERFILFSLIVGARAPDTEGGSLTNLSVLRAVHSDPEGQYPHCLRAADDDYDEGNASALEGCRASILENLRLAFESIRDEPDELIEVPLTLDNYGSFDIDVNPAAYHLGRALHALEDSFTHTLRTPDLRRVVHVMNYEAAIAGDLHEERDGIAHSNAVDSCAIVASVTGGVVNRDRVFAAIEAVADLIRAFVRAITDLRAGETDLTVLAAEVEAVLLKWLQLADPADLGDFTECSEANDYCDSPWLESARLEPATPVLGCSAGPTSPSALAGLVFLGLLALARARHRRRR